MSNSKRVQIGRYELLERIGAGGMAEVFRARLPGPQGFEKIVVVKRILPSFESDRFAAQMLVEEAKISARANHDNIAQVFELGQSEDGRFFIVLEHVDGVDLAQLAATARNQGGELPVWLSVHIYAEVLEALSFLHEMRGAEGELLGFVHRDVTPSNIFVSHLGKVKLGDFGVARFSGKSATTLAGQLKGKLQYMSPEQLSNKPLDRRADLFAVGVGLWESLALRPLFAGNDPEVMIAICEGERRRPSELNANVPHELDACVLRALAIDREARFQSAAEMQSVLLDVLHKLRPSLRRAEVRRALQRILHAEHEEEEDDTASISEEAGREAERRMIRDAPTAVEERAQITVPPRLVGQTREARFGVAPTSRIEPPESAPPRFEIEDSVTTPFRLPAQQAPEATEPVFWVRSGSAGPVTHLPYTAAIDRLREGGAAGQPLSISADGRRWVDLTELSRLAGLDLVAATADAPSNVTVIGTLEQCSIFAAIGILARDRHTGTLAIARTKPVTGEWYELHILEGRPTRVVTNVDAMQLPMLLVRERLIDASRMPHLMQSVIREQRPLEELVEVEAGRSFGRHALMIARLAALLAWDSADYTFSVDYKMKREPPFARSMFTPIVWVVERMFSAEQLLERMKDRVKRKLVAREHLHPALAEMDLEPRARALVTRLESGQTIAEVLDAERGSAKLLLALAYVLTEAELLGAAT